MHAYCVIICMYMYGVCVCVCIYIYTYACVCVSVSYSLSSIVLANGEYVNCIQQRMVGFADIVFLWVELCFPQRYVQVLTPGVCECSVTKSCPILCSPMDCSPVSFVNGIFQARILERVAISSFRGSSRPSAQTWVSLVSCTAGGSFATEPSEKPHDAVYLKHINDNSNDKWRIWRLTN